MKQADIKGLLLTVVGVALGVVLANMIQAKMLAKKSKTSTSADFDEE